MILKLIASLVLIFGFSGCSSFKSNKILGVWTLYSSSDFKLDLNKNTKIQLKKLSIDIPKRILFEEDTVIFELTKNKVRQDSSYELSDSGFILHTPGDNVYTPFTFIDDDHISVYWNGRLYKYINGGLAR